jgi:hypothetical protein
MGLFQNPGWLGIVSGLFERKDVQRVWVIEAVHISKTGFTFNPRLSPNF